MQLPILARRLRNKVVENLLPIIIRQRPRPDLVRIGTVYAGWWIPGELFASDSVCYLAGAGEDISFDLGLMKLFGCSVVSVDPTPRAIQHVAARKPEAGYHFLPIGLGGTNRIERFYTPANPQHVSHSIANLQKTSAYFEAELRTVKSLMAEHGHTSIDLLKIDIEGAEYEVLDSLLRDCIFPRVLCIEFDQPQPLSKTVATIRRLKDAGYSVVKIEDFNVTLVSESHGQ